LNGLDKKKIGLLSLILFVFLAILLFPNLNLSSEDIQNYFQSQMLRAILGFLLLYAIKSITMTIPNSVLYVAAGAVFPIGVAILVTYIGLMVSLTVGYLTGQKLGETKVYHLLAKQKRVNHLLDKYKEDLFPLCFMTRLLALPFGFVSFFFGALKIPFLKYILASLLGVTPGMLPIIFSGAAITNPLSPEFLIPFGVSLTVISITFTIYKRKTAAVSAT